MGWTVKKAGPHVNVMNPYFVARIGLLIEELRLMDEEAREEHTRGNNEQTRVVMECINGAFAKLVHAETKILDPQFSGREILH